MFKKIGRGLSSFGKKLGNAYKSVKGFGKKVMGGLDNLGIGDLAREAGNELVQAGRSELEKRGVNVAGAEQMARQGLQFAEASPDERRAMGRQALRSGVQRGLGELRSRLGRA